MNVASPTKALSSLLVLLLLGMTLSGCTIIRYVDNNDDKPDPKEPDPKVVDMLVMVELDRSATSMADAYQTIYLQLVAAMALKEITVRKVALAPMYRQSGGAVPLIWGLGDPNAEFSDLGSAVFFFAKDDGQNYLRDRVDTDGENLAALGLDLDTRSLYHPTTADPNAVPYYTTPSDGFVVVQMSAKARGCGYSDAACELGGQTAAAYFTEQSEDQATWLQLAGQQSLPSNKIYHLLIATSEGVDIDTFIDNCERQPGFPAGKLDYMEPSQKSYFGPLAGQIQEKGGRGQFMDMCTAMSPVAAVPSMAQIATEMRQMF